jgi:hypothetical protein
MRSVVILSSFSCCLLTFGLLATAADRAGTQATDIQTQTVGTR